jgi:uncharacterized protein (TIGR03084 family)
MPEVDVAVRLTGPAGGEWTWGESEHDSVTGSALDFCMVVTQRRHVDDTHLQIVGDAATEWMRIAQAFAGGVGAGRQPGEFRGQ